ncbi:MAG: hypothetical protein CO029_00415 [Candidatus Magasanikbacteria bacterium CG_4_9_14_0_2_um_filter_41_10]|uniref:Uncharacterized protein n=1 Tax=Candidatus Magasanikbacteria bacterium CG_4_10_14_0_2_um_filter_41_31 TaxID=1974639 RepID=A0A2M7V3Q2_9BACT|nr:MAG: hypothetical protein AUJ37_04310 [Candidatus Magasanikbacteria bacterium CG1_02_41_34]PIZ93038.1 MAG: hypothetical protein COX83_02800 [Candidatus Magasanikbacteria bacterium CG_4_10_14_0_2_um_filter_41_31]PJC53879.1 MAG: hypothetical protein CO029_00415 [Candidatus Magasanikbacteria bacterium CG_4_9_14_0_2_um_filter_41_10]
MKKQLPELVEESTSTSSQEEIVDLMKKNIAWSEAVYNQNKKIQKTLRWMSTMGYVRVLIFLIPIILGIIYLPPLLGGVWDQYQSIIGLGGNTSFDADSVRSLIEQFSSN